MERVRIYTGTAKSEYAKLATTVIAKNPAVVLLSNPESFAVVDKAIEDILEFARPMLVITAPSDDAAYALKEYITKTHTLEVVTRSYGSKGFELL